MAEPKVDKEQALYVRPLSQITAADKFQVGGKALNLAKLIQADLPVPQGFAVGLNAFSDEGLLKENAKQAIQGFIELNVLYDVRSSALTEDAEGASWAGQFETFLDTEPEDVIKRVEECHNSAKRRAEVYAEDKAVNTFNVAVVVQEMLKPEYAGVLFTKDPLTGEDTLVTEYIEGLGEDLVSGIADPTRVVLRSDEALHAPFDSGQLAHLAASVEQLFGMPQDVEWVWADSQIWLVQARPITATQEARNNYYLGEPDELFYWGPSRAKPQYMSDFMAAAERFFTEIAADPKLPNPPKTVVLFCEDKMVWLSNARQFADFTKQTFAAYEQLDRLDADIARWKMASERVNQVEGDARDAALIDTWYATEFAEFSLYGAESALVQQLSRFDSKVRQDIWAAFTVPDKPTFLNRIDAELIASQDPEATARQYPWIQNGYSGVSDTAEAYFEKRLATIGAEIPVQPDLEARRQELIRTHALSEAEARSLTLARQLAEFMDDRKAWMMQTRHLLTHNLGSIEYGWLFADGQSSLIGKEDTTELWQRYVNFKGSTSAVMGVVASNGGKHFLSGEVVVVMSPTDIVGDGKIVVVPATSPSYVPLMRKAKALVTDHGGTMSHAAIVAREFNLPCIVGTKQATKVLQTGDKVVLDLVTGEVNK